MACSLFGRPLPASRAGRAGARPDHSITGSPNRGPHQQNSGPEHADKLAENDVNDLQCNPVNWLCFKPLARTREA
jgi:hypothetical protein